MELFDYIEIKNINENAEQKIKNTLIVIIDKCLNFNVCILFLVNESAVFLCLVTHLT